MRMFKYLVPLAAVLLAGCGLPGPKYNWGDYQTSLYAYYGDPKAEAAYEKSLNDIAANDGKPGRKAPPGLLAEYGYIAQSHGDTDKAIQLFQREKQAWPESTVFMNKAIDNARNGKKPAAEAPSSPPVS